MSKVPFRHYTLLVAGFILLLAVGCSVTWLVKQPDGSLLMRLEPAFFISSQTNNAVTNR